MSLRIRRVKPEDEAQLSYICLMTAAAGTSAEHYHEWHKQTLPGLVYALPYTRIHTSWGFVLEDEETLAIRGYILGSTDTREFERLMQESWIPTFVDDYPESTAVMMGDKHLSALIRNMPEAPEANIGFSPVHLRINILENWRRKGWGRKLVAEAVHHLRKMRFTQLWVEVDERNEGARKFFTRIGFQEIDGAVDTNQLGLVFNDFDAISRDKDVGQPGQGSKSQKTPTKKQKAKGRSGGKR